MGFWDHFYVTIPENNALPRIEKTKYLITYLTDKTKQAVEGIRIMTSPLRFYKNDLDEVAGLRTSIWTNFLSTTLVRSLSHVASLRKLCDQVQACANSLNGLGVPPAQYAVLLYRILMHSLPDDLAILYMQKISESETQTAGTVPD